MNVYKLTLGAKGYHAIDKDDYEERTGRRPPWYKTSDRGTPQYFAVCPACDNPIQIIGFYKRLNNTPHPYGKHVPKPIPGVGHYDHDAYLWCPYSKENTGNNEERPKRDGSYITEQLLATLITHFDKVVYLLGKNIGIMSMKPKLVESMLRQYRREEGWLYARATLMNVPWTFAYMTDYQKILYQTRLTPALTDALVSQAPDHLSVSETGFLIRHPDCKAYVDLGIYFTRHHHQVQGETLTESMDCVFTLTVAKQTNREIHRITIDFNYQHFNNLAHLDRWTETTSGQIQLQLAEDILGPLCHSRKAG